MSDYSLAVWRQKNGEPNLPLPPKPRKKRGNAESAIQSAVVKWFDLQCRVYGLPSSALFAIPNGGWRDPVGAAILKREGQRNGVCDLMLCVARGKYHGCFLEMKAPGGKTSPEQDDFIRSLLARDYCARVCYSYDEAVGLITRYLAGEENL